MKSPEHIRSPKEKHTAVEDVCVFCDSLSPVPKPHLIYAAAPSPNRRPRVRDQNILYYVNPVSLEKALPYIFRTFFNKY